MVISDVNFSPGDRPEFLAGRRVVAAQGVGAVGDQFGAGLALVDGGRAPGGDLVARGPPALLAGLDVERGDERVLLDVGLDDDAVFVDDGGAAHAPLVVGVEEPAGVHQAEVFASRPACRS